MVSTAEADSDRPPHDPYVRPFRSLVATGNSAPGRWANIATMSYPEGLGRREFAE